MLRSAVGVMTVLLSVAELFPDGSLTPAGAVMVAVLVMVPEPAVTVAVAVKVAVPPASKLTLALRLPLPLAGQLDPADAAHVQVTPASCAGKTSLTVAPVTALGPALLATIVYVSVAPWSTAVTPSVFVIARSAVGVMTVLLSVAELFPAGSLTPAGAVMVAVLVIVPEPAVTVAVAVKVAVPPASRLTLALRLPLPLAGQLDPADAAHVHVTPLSCAGKTSLTVAPVTALGPALLATIVYVSVPPWSTAVTPSVFVITRSAVGVITVLLSVAELFPAGSLTPAGAVMVAV